VRVTSSLENILTPTAIALGNFDGLHQGHCQAIRPIVNTTSKDRIYPTVVTFDPHPQEFFTGQPRKLLTPLPEKIEELKALNIEQLVLLPFDRELASLSPREFVERILVSKIKAKQINVGEDFCFGRGRAGTAADLQAIAKDYGAIVNRISLQKSQGQKISSSAIREYLLEGNIMQANRLLGRPYSLIGEVIIGQQLGRKIGFPTANLQLPPDKFLPRQGVYCGRVFIDRQVTDENRHPSFPEPLLGAINIGTRPTLAGVKTQVEVHLLNWQGDLYGKTLRVNLEKFLRPEKKFASVEELQAQIERDCQETIAFFP